MALFPRFLPRMVGFGLRPNHIEDIFEASSRLMRQSLAELERDTRTLTAAIPSAEYQLGKDGFKIAFDVEQFKPNEVKVKVQDNTVIVEGKHEEREDDHGFISRHFVRRYALPKEVDVSQLTSTLSSDGVLTIKAPTLALEGKTERVIEVEHIGPTKEAITDKSSSEK